MQLLYCFTHPEQVVEVITEVLDKVHVTHFGKKQVLRLLGERNLNIISVMSMRCQMYSYDSPWHMVARPSGRGRLSRSLGA